MRVARRGIAARLILAVVILAVSVVVGCQGKPSAGPGTGTGFTPPPVPKFTPDPRPAQIRTYVVRGIGRILTDGQHMTLYTRNTPAYSRRPM